MINQIPLIIFAFNRPELLKQIIDAIKQQTVKPSHIVGIIDGPRYETDVPLVNSCKLMLSNLCDEVIERANNLGCATNIMLGTMDIANRYGSFVVIEDDVLPARHWYESMCLLLDRYKDDQRVGAVGGFPSIPNSLLKDYPDVFASPRFSCWGFGSYKDRWEKLCSEWTHYKMNGRPPWDASKLPDHGGSDIKHMIMNHPGLWDAVVAGSFLHHGLVQAITKHYLVNNIGASQHISGYKLKYMLDNNKIEDKLPITFPESTNLDYNVCRAVCEYVKVMG